MTHLASLSPPTRSPEPTGPSVGHPMTTVAFPRPFRGDFRPASVHRLWPTFHDARVSRLTLEDNQDPLGVYMAPNPVP